MSLKNVIWKLNIGKKSSLNSVFKYHKIRNVTQTLLIENSYQTLFFFAHSFQYLNTENCYLKSIIKQALKIVVAKSDFFTTRWNKNLMYVYI